MQIDDHDGETTQPLTYDGPTYIGPLLYLRGHDENGLHLAALIVRPATEPLPSVVANGQQSEPVVLHRRRGFVVTRYHFSLPASGGRYSVADESFEVAGAQEGDLRLAYVSCNGQEHGDGERTPAERNVMWERLAEQHQEKSFQLLLHGGDQLYADEVLRVHPIVEAWADGDVPHEVSSSVLQEVREKLRDFLFDRYLQLYCQGAPAWLHARVPSLCMWDDHDICDGWGSLAAEKMDSSIGREVFRAAREFFMLFQLGCVDGELPAICSDPEGTTLTWAAKLPGTLVIAPDLRSERRPDRVMGRAGWTALEKSLAAAGSDDHVFILSSVPLLGPRLSWVEAVMHLIPGMQKYEDDLRDQWQSHAHREEWRRMLQTVMNVHERGSTVTILSGEIHLATRGTMSTSRGPLHQLIASGIAHPPPTPWYGRALGTLARLGETPLPEHPIRLHPLPGKGGIYTSQRNYLVLERSANRWSARWELEQDGSTPPLPI